MSSFAKIVTTQKPNKVEPLKSGNSGAMLATYDNNVRAVIKKRKKTLPNGKHHQRGLSVLTQHRREVAYYQLAKLFGFEQLVPETVLTLKVFDDQEECSAQAFVPAQSLKEIQPLLAQKNELGDDWSQVLVHAALKVPRSQWRQLLALDIVAGVRDRHSGNVGLSLGISQKNVPEYHVVAWDNACTFGRTFAKYHNVFHKYLFRTVVDFETIWPIWNQLTREDYEYALAGLLTQEEIDDAYLRMQFFQQYPYKLPWSVCSEGRDDANEFPDYQNYFQPLVTA